MLGRIHVRGLSPSCAMREGRYCRDCSWDGAMGTRAAKRAEARELAAEIDAQLEDDEMPDEEGYPETWAEAEAAFERAEPVEVVRPLRHVMVVYACENGTYSATSPQLPSFGEASEDPARLREAVRLRLESFLDPAVEVTEVIDVGNWPGGLVTLAMQGRLRVAPRV